MRYPCRQGGFTVTEALVSALVLAILAALAIPAFVGLFERNRLKAVADMFYTDLQYARSEAVKRNAAIYLDVASGASWAYGMGSNSACACAAGACSNCDIKVVIGADFSDVTLSASTLAAAGIYFEQRQGLALQTGSGNSASGNVSFVNTQGEGIDVGLSALGQPNICTPGGALAEYATC